MDGPVSFSARRKDEKCTNGMEKEELKEMRHGRMSRCERLREWSASILRVILLFGTPVILSLVMFIVLVAVYIIRPYALTRDFTRTSCQVEGYYVLNETSSSCSAGTDPFQPCVKIEVSYPTGEGRHNGIIMENEQSLINCNPCSYTFGRHGLIHHYQYACESWKENFNPQLCVRDFLAKHAVSGSVHTCYFNPENAEQVVRELVLDENMLIHSVSWPILSCFIYILGWGFVFYDLKQRKMINEFIVTEMTYKRRREQLQRYRATEWKKQRLGQTLGVRSPMQSPNSFLVRSVNDLKKMSASLPSLTDISHNPGVMRPGNLTESTDCLDNDEAVNFDLRHLDLAVSQQNLNDLTTTYPYLETPPPLTYENVTAAFGVEDNFHQKGRSRATLPVSPLSPMSTFQRPSKCTGKSTNAFFHESASFSVSDRFRINTRQINVGSASFAPLSNRSFFYQERRQTDFASVSAVSEDEIDAYFSVGQRYSENAIDVRRGRLFCHPDESRV